MSLCGRPVRELLSRLSLLELNARVRRLPGPCLREELRKKPSGEKPGHRRVAGQGQDDQQVPGQGLLGEGLMGHVRDLPKKKLGVDVKKGFAVEYEVLALQEEDARRAEGGGRERRRRSTSPPTPTARARRSAGTWPKSSCRRRRSKAKAKQGPPGGLQRDHEARDRGGLQEPDAGRRQEGRRPAGPPRPRPPGGLQGQPDPLGQGAPGPLRRARADRRPSLICDREREIQAFKPEEYWTVRGPGPGQGSRRSFAANLVKRDGKNLEVTNGEEAAAVRADLEAAALQGGEGAGPRAPAQPRAALHHDQAAAGGLPQAALPRPQDHAGRAAPLRGDRARGARAAVGLITYMRTDSTRVSADALAAVRAQIAEVFGEDYVPEKPNVYTAKKDAQDAHEAIRPTDLERDPGGGEDASSSRTSSRSTPSSGTASWPRRCGRPSTTRRWSTSRPAPPANAPVYLLRAKGSTLQVQGLPRRVRGGARRRRSSEAGGRGAAPARRTTRSRRRGHPAAPARGGPGPRPQEARHRPALHPAARPASPRRAS